MTNVLFGVTIQTQFPQKVSFVFSLYLSRKKRVNKIQDQIYQFVRTDVNFFYGEISGNRNDKVVEYATEIEYVFGHILFDIFLTRIEQS